MCKCKRLSSDHRKKKYERSKKVRKFHINNCLIKDVKKSCKKCMYLPCVWPGWHKLSSVSTWYACPSIFIYSRLNNLLSDSRSWCTVENPTTPPRAHNITKNHQNVLYHDVYDNIYIRRNQNQLSDDLHCDCVLWLFIVTVYWLKSIWLYLELKQHYKKDLWN